MCYFVNLLLILAIWVAPQSKRLFISTYCLAYGNNAVAIAMWRNSVSHFSRMFSSVMALQMLSCMFCVCDCPVLPVFDGLTDLGMIQMVFHSLDKVTR